MVRTELSPYVRHYKRPPGKDTRAHRRLQTKISSQHQLVSSVPSPERPADPASWPMMRPSEPNVDELGTQVSFRSSGSTHVDPGSCPVVKFPGECLDIT